MGISFNQLHSTVNYLLLIVSDQSTRILLIREMFWSHILKKCYQTTKLSVLLEMVFASYTRLKSVLLKLEGTKSACPTSSKN